MRRIDAVAWLASLSVGSVVAACAAGPDDPSTIPADEAAGTQAQVVPEPSAAGDAGKSTPASYGSYSYKPSTYKPYLSR